MVKLCRCSDVSSLYLAKANGTKMKGKKFIYAHKFENVPKVTDLQLAEEEIPKLKEGGMF